MDYRKYIVRNKKICGGAPVFKGTRVTLRTILACLDDGDSEEQLIDSFPTLNKTHVRAAIAFAAASAVDDMPYAGAPSLAGSI